MKNEDDAASTYTPLGPAANWPPAEQYPVVVVGHGSTEVTTAVDVELVDFGRTLSGVGATNWGAEAERIIKALLRERAAKGLPMPYPSSVESLSGRDGFIAMVSTKGWDQIKEEDEPE